jgi:hypothetical protein
MPLIRMAISITVTSWLPKLLMLKWIVMCARFDTTARSILSGSGYRCNRKRYLSPVTPMVGRAAPVSLPRAKAALRPGRLPFPGECWMARF